MRTLKRLLAMLSAHTRGGRRGALIDRDLLEERRRAETDYQLHGGGPPAHL